MKFDLKPVEAMHFSPEVSRRLGYYVYVLADQSRDIFYVGKGKANRIFAHINGIRDWKEDTGKQLLEDDRLQHIRELGQENILHAVVRHGLDEDTAFEIEATLIDLIGLESLTCKVRGRYSFLRGMDSVKGLLMKYQTKGELQTDEKMLLININGTFREDMTPEEVIEVTRQSWILGKRREQVKYILSVYQGTVVEVMEVVQNSWTPDYSDPKRDRDHPRWRCEAKLVDEEIRDKYLHVDVSEYYAGGRANPVRYINM